MPSLRDKTVSGIFWSIIQKVGSRGITFLVTIVLARILMPKDFGLIGMLMVFISLSQVLVGAGFSQALIQKKNPDEEDYSSVFYINLAVSLLLYGILFFAAPGIAAFYNQPALINLTRGLSVVFVLNAFSYVQEARLSKEMRFKTLAIIHIPASIIAGLTSVVMAKMGYGVWSIVALQVVQRLLYAIQIWIYAKWKPLWSFNRQKARRLFSFGSKLMLSGMIESVYSNIYLIVIGKFFPVNMVGYYQNANNIIQQPASTFSAALSSVTFPAFASIQHDNQKLKQGYKKIIQQLLFWIGPAFIFAGVLAEPLFRFVFTAKWLPAIPYFQILCIVGILYPLNAFNLNIVNVKGRSDIFLKLELLKKIIITLGIIFSLSFGIWALLVFQALNSIFAFWLNSHFSGKFIQYSMKEQLKDVFPLLLLGLGMGAIVFIFNWYYSGMPDFLRLIMGFGLGIVGYWFFAKLLKIEPYFEFLYLIKNRRSKSTLK